MTYIYIDVGIYICCGPSFVLNDLRWEVVVCLLIFEELLTITVWTSCLISRKESLSSQRQLPLFNLDREVELLRESDQHPHVIRYFCMVSFTFADREVVSHQKS
jgi:hypothetical protein